MDFQKATEYFQTLLSTIKNTDKEQFLLWTKTKTADLLEKMESEDNSTVIMNSIRDDIRNTLPLEAVTSTETIVCPKTGENADCDPRTTVHVDAFLYDDDAIDELCDEGKMTRNYCTQCSSRSVEPLTFISHSASVEQIKFIYQYLLRDLRGKTVLDVGSRTGAILYGAHFYSEAECIIGVELDPSFYQLQTRMVDKYKLGDRIQVVQGDILHHQELLQKSDVIVLNNVFEFFMSEEQQVNIWQFLYQTIRKKNTVLITLPSIEETLSNIRTSINLTSWLKPSDISCVKSEATTRYFSNSNSSDLSDIFMYEVI